MWARLLLAFALACGVRGFTRTPLGVHLVASPRVCSVVAPRVARVVAAVEPLPELPTPALLKAIARCGSTATAADVAAEAGQDIDETRRQLLVLARLVAAELQVSDDGELLFVFDKPGVLRRALRSQSVRQRVRDVWGAASPPIMWMARASFGVGLLASLTLVTVAITAMAASKDGESSSSRAPPMTMLWGPSPFDFLYYSTRPYGYGYYTSNEKGFLQSCFSLLFGDGDTNAQLPQRTSAAAAALIRANGGAVTAEQLAPLLNAPISPAQYEEESLRPGAPVREDWMLPLLIQFKGEPVVTEEGDLIYSFPELMATAEVHVHEAHSSPLTTHRSPLTTHHSPLTTRPSPLATHHSPLTTSPPHH